MHKWLLALSFAFFTVGSVTVARAQPADGPHAGLRAIFAQLDLTPEQRDQLKQLHQQRRAQEQAIRGQLRDLRQQFAAALTGNTSDDDLRALHTQLAQKRNEFAAFRFEGLLQVRKILTPDQSRRFGELFIQNRMPRAGRGDGQE